MIHWLTLFLSSLALSSAQHLFSRDSEAGDANIMYSTTLYEKIIDPKGITPPQYVSLSVNQYLLLAINHVPPNVPIYRRAYRYKPHTFRDGYVRHMFIPHKESEMVRWDLVNMPAMLTETQTRFRKFEAEEHPSVASLFAYIEIDEPFLDFVLTGPNLKMHELVTDLGHYALNRNPDITKRILQHPDLVDWGQNHRALLKPEKYAEFIASLLIRKTDHRDMFEEVISGLQREHVKMMFDQMLAYRMRKGKYPKAAPFLLNDKTMMDHLTDEDFKPFADQLVKDAAQGAGMTTLLTSDALAHRFPEGALSSHLQTLSKEQMVFELLQFLGRPNALKFVSDADLNQVTTDFIQSPTDSMVVEALMAEYIAPRISGHNWGGLLLLTVVSNNPMGGAILSNESVMKRVPQELFDLMMDRIILEFTEAHPIIIKGLTESFNAERITSSQWKDIMGGFLQGDRKGLEFLFNTPNVIESLTDSDTKILTSVFKSNMDKIMDSLPELLTSKFASAFTSQDWSEILTSITQEKNYPAIESVVEKGVIDTLPEDVQSSFYKGAAADLKFIVSMKPAVSQKLMGQKFRGLFGGKKKQPPTIQNVMRQQPALPKPVRIVHNKPLLSGNRIRPGHGVTARIMF